MGGNLVLHPRRGPNLNSLDSLRVENVDDVGGNLVLHPRRGGTNLNSLTVWGLKMSMMWVTIWSFTSFSDRPEQQAVTHSRVTDTHDRVLSRSLSTRRVERKIIRLGRN